MKSNLISCFLRITYKERLENFCFTICKVANSYKMRIASEMNIFFNLTSQAVGDFSIEVLNQLITRYKTEELYVVHFSINNGNELKLIQKPKECYSYEDMVRAEYNNYLYAKVCPPVDKDLIDNMKGYEPEIIKMMERFSRMHDFALDYDSRIRMYHSHIRYWNYLLDRANMGVAVFINVPHEVYDYIIYCLCKVKNIPTAISYPGHPSGYRYFFHDIKLHCSELIQTYQHLRKDYESLSIDEIVLPEDFQKAFELYSDCKSDKTPYYMKREYFGSKKESIIKRVVRLPKKIQREGTEYIKIRAKYTKQCLEQRIKYHDREKVIKSEFDKSMKVYDELSVEMNLSEKYIYLPLHYEPECAVNPLGDVYLHQYLVAEMLSFYLPDNVKLYVKEHPVQGKYGFTFFKSQQFFRNLSKRDNIRLINRNEDTYKLLENCVAVASVTGTAGFEGMFMEKPFLIFGYHINMFAPGAFAIRNNKDCEDAIDFILKYGAKHTLKDMKIYLKALSEVEVYCSIWEPLVSVSVEENIKRIKEGYEKVIDAQLEL